MLFFLSSETICSLKTKNLMSFCWLKERQNPEHSTIIKKKKKLELTMTISNYEISCRRKKLIHSD